MESQYIILLTSYLISEPENPTRTWLNFFNSNSSGATIWTINMIIKGWKRQFLKTNAWKARHFKFVWWTVKMKLVTIKILQNVKKCYIKCWLCTRMAILTPFNIQLKLAKFNQLKNRSSIPNMEIINKRYLIKTKYSKMIIFMRGGILRLSNKG